jgi:hypothetical protein
MIPRDDDWTLFDEEAEQYLQDFAVQRDHILETLETRENVDMMIDVKAAFRAVVYAAFETKNTLTDNEIRAFLLWTGDHVLSVIGRYMINDRTDGSGVSRERARQMLDHAWTKISATIGLPIAVTSVRGYRPREHAPIPDEKQCCKCGVVKPLDEFHRNVNRRDGRVNTCKACSREYQAALWAKKRRDSLQQAGD